MDNLPKKSGNDWSAFSGKYPTDKGATTPPPAVGGPTSSAGVTPPKTATTPVSPPPPPSPEPFAKPQTNTIPGTPTPAPTEASPFIVGAQPVPTKPASGGGIRRIILFLLLLVILVGAGGLIYKVVGGLLFKNQPVTLTYWGLWEDEQILRPVLDEYKKIHPNIEIVYSRQSHKQYRERLQAAINRGEGPDIFRFHNTWVPMLSAELAPADKTGYTAAEFGQTFYPVAVKDLVVGGKVYGVPLMIDGLGLYYNEDLLRAAGVTPPSSWEDFRKSALTLTVKDQSGQIVTAGTALGTANNVEHFSDIVTLMFLQNGASPKNPTSKEAQEALSFYRLFAEKPNNVWDGTMDNSITAFATGKVAMIFAPSWQAFTIKQTNPNLKFQIIPVPQLPGTTITWASYWVEGVSSKSKHQSEAWEFLKFLSSKDSLVTMYTEAAKDKSRMFGEPYSRIDLAQTVVNDPLVGTYVRQAPTAQSFFLSSRTYDNGINDRMIKYLEDAVNSLDKGVSIDAALQTVAAGFSQVLSNFGYSAPGSQ